jgi:uncharacterized protein
VRIGVVSDTHNHLPNVGRIVELLNGAGVERVVHTGDITQAKTLHAMAGLRAPLVGVFGNNDVERDALGAAAARHGFTFGESGLEIALAGRRIVVVHDPREIATRRDFDVALHGHTHRLTVERETDRLVFNPGECAGHLAGYNAIGVVDLRDLSVELLKF